MKISVILAHPNENSFNHAVALTAVERLRMNGHAVIFHDLYKERFGPLLPREEFQKEAPLPETIAQHCNEIADADGIIARAALITKIGIAHVPHPKRTQATMSARGTVPILRLPAATRKSGAVPSITTMKKLNFRLQPGYHTNN
jgi:hypothetical protein